MNQGFYIALSGAKIQEVRLETLANNLANVNTAGYKADKVISGTFQYELDSAIDNEDMLPHRISASSALNAGEDSAPYYRGTYTRTVGVTTSFTQGDHKHTGNPLNVALNGPGFIAVETPQGVRYTRQGVFNLNSEGQLVTPEGYRVKGKGLTDLSGGKFVIDSGGNVLVGGEELGQFFIDSTGNISVGEMEKGKIDIVEFEKPELLRKQGHSLFVTNQRPLRGKASGNTEVKQGFLEMANINVMKEMVNMIELNRLYESYQKVMTSIDESVGKVINEIGRT